MFDVRTRNNAFSSYLLIGVCATFFFVKGNPSLDNDFVKSHTKTALFLQLFLVINWFLFIHLGFFSGFVFLNYGLNEIISIIFFLSIFTFMLFAMYKALKGEYFTIKDFGNLTKTEDLVEISENIEMNEKDKMTLILAHIPFLGFFVYGKYYEFRNSILDNIIKLNTYSSAFILFIYILGHYNIANILVLFYLLFIVFSSISILTNGTIINLNLRYLKDTKSYLILLKSFFIYIKNYFSSFKNFYAIELETRFLEEQREKEDIVFLSSQKDLKISPYLIYIPIFNIAFASIKDTKYANHIKNGFSISLVFIIILVLNFFGEITNLWLLLLLFPIVYGISYIKRLEYRLAFLNDFYELLEKMIVYIIHLLHLVKTKQKEEKEVKFSINSDKKDEIL